MSQEQKYLDRILKHDLWHTEEKGIKPYDQSCRICHQIHPSVFTKEFRDFWDRWIVPRCNGIAYTRHTIDLFEEAQVAKGTEQLESILS